MRKFKKSDYKQIEHYTPSSKREKNLIKALVSVKNDKEAAALVRDLMTIAEIEEFANRLEIARLLSEGYSYQEIAEKTEVSTTTVTRVAHWFFHGCGGYKKVLNKL